MRDWRDGDADARALAPGLWLAFTVSALRSLRFRVVLVRLPARPGERFRHTFDDALARPTAEAVQLYAQTLGRPRPARGLKASSEASARADAVAPYVDP